MTSIRCVIASKVWFATILFLPLIIGVSPAFAQCAFVITSGDDVHVCSSGTAPDLLDSSGNNTLRFPEGATGTVSGNVEFGAGNDTVEFTPGGTATVQGDINLGTGDDRLLVNSGTIEGDVDQGLNNDVFVMSGGTIVGNVQQNDGVDDFEMTGGTIGSLNQGNDLDTFTMSGGRIIGAFEDGDVGEMSGGRIGRVNLRLADNVFDMSGGAIDNNLVAGFGNDTITMSGGSVGGNISVSGGDDVVTITGGSVGGEIRLSFGNDQFTWTDGGTIGGEIDFAAGDDTARLTGLSAAQTSGPDAFLGDTGNDEVTITNSIVEDASRFTGWENIDVLSSSQLGLDGRLSLGDAISGTGQLEIDGSSTLLVSDGIITSADGSESVSVVNAGTIDMAARGGVGNRLRIGGNYESQTGRLTLGAALGGDDSPTDRLEVSGDTSGQTGLLVSNESGTGAPTTNGIPVVLVEGASDGTFFLAEPDYVNPDGDPSVVGGAFGYTLTGREDGWYLNSRLRADEVTTGDLNFQPAAPVYEALPRALTFLNEIKPAQKRGGLKFSDVFGTGPTGQRSGQAIQRRDCVREDDEKRGTVRLDDCDHRDGQERIAGAAWSERLVPTKQWARIDVSSMTVRPRRSDTVRELDLEGFVVRAGIDFVPELRGDSIFVLGVNGFFGQVDMNVASEIGSGSVNSKGYGLGLTGTWFWPDGRYVDLQGQISLFDSDLESDQFGSLENGNLGNGQAIALEIGRHFSNPDWAPDWSFKPYTQAVYSRTGFEDFRGPHGETVSSTNESQIRLTVGSSVAWDLAPESADDATRLYGGLNANYDALDDPGANVGGYRLTSELDSISGEITLGGEHIWNDGKNSILGEVAYLTGLESNERQEQVSASISLEMTW